MTSCPRRLVATAAVVGLALAGAAPAASATTADDQAALDSLLSRLSAPAQPPAELDAGYSKTGAFDIAVTKSFVIPEFDCTGATTDLVVLGHASPERQILAGVITSCAFGVTGVVAQVAGGQSGSVLAEPGQKIVIETTRDGDSMTTTVMNVATGEEVTSTGTFTEESFLLGAITDPGWEVTDFGTAKLTKNAIDGKTIKKGLTKLDMVTKGELRVKTSKIKKGTFSLIHKAL